jgi:hypothetical protein
MVVHYVRRYRDQGSRLKKRFSLLAVFTFVPVPLFITGATAGAPRGDPNARDRPHIEEAATSTVIDDFLNSLNGHMRILGVEYRGNQLRTSRTFTEGRLASGNANWVSTAAISNSKISDQSDCLDISLSFKLTFGSANSFGIAVAFDFLGWSIDNYTLAPAQIYGGNRFRVYDIGYPPYIQNEDDRPLDMPITVTNILHLNQDGSPALIELNTGNLATPMLSFFNPKANRGFILLTEQRTRFGNNGLSIQEDAEPGAPRSSSARLGSANSATR